MSNAKRRPGEHPADWSPAHDSRGQPNRSDGRFEKGRSGNPRGRPKKQKIATVLDRPSAHALGDVAYRRVTPIIDGEPTPMTMIEALIQRRFTVAMKGENRLLMREVMGEVSAYEQHMMEVYVRAYVRYEQLKRDGEVSLAAAEAAGMPAPVLLPHPNDIILNEETTEYSIVGPETEAQLAAQTYLVLVRDFMVMRWSYQTRFTDPDEPVRVALESFKQVAIELNARLPARLQWSPAGFWSAKRSYEKLGIRAFDRLMRHAQFDISQRVKTLPKKMRRAAAPLEPLMDWQSRSRQRRIRQHLFDKSRWMAARIFADPRVADEAKVQLTESDLPRIFAKVPDLMAELGLVLGADGQYRARSSLVPD